MKHSNPHPLGVIAASKLTPPQLLSLMAIRDTRLNPWRKK